MTTEMQRVDETPNMMGLLQLAISNNSAIDVIERLAALQRETREYQAKVAFDNAMQRVQARMRRIGVNKASDKSKYVTYDKLDGVLRPLYSEEGLSVSFNTEGCAVDMVRVLAYVSHVDGHTRTYQIDMPADGKGAKGNDVMTRTHATGSAVTYGKRYLLSMIFNVAIGETDDDGNAAGGGKKMAGGEIDRYADLMRDARTLAELQKIFAEAYRETKGDTNAVNFLTSVKDERKVELS